MKQDAGLVEAYPSAGEWAIVALEATGSCWTPLRRYRLLRIAFGLDAGLARVEQNDVGWLFVDGRRCRLLEQALRDSPYTADRMREAKQGLRGYLRPWTSWQDLFQKEFSGAIPRWSMVAWPFRLGARRQLRDEDPEVVQWALVAFPLPLRWRLLRRRMRRMDTIDAQIRVEEGVVEVEQHDGSWRRDSLLESAVKAWTTPGNFIEASEEFVGRRLPEAQGDDSDQDEGPPPGSVQLQPAASSWDETQRLLTQRRPQWRREHTAPELQHLLATLDAGELEVWLDPGHGLWACTPQGRCWSVGPTVRPPRGQKGVRRGSRDSGRDGRGRGVGVGGGS